MCDTTGTGSQAGAVPSSPQALGIVVDVDVGGTLNAYNPMTPPSFFVIITVAERGRATAPPGP